MKFMNFSRKPNPSVVHVGCHFGNAGLDVTKAIGENLLNFPHPAATLEDVLRVEGGLESLEEQLRKLEPSVSGVQSCVVDESDIVFRPPVMRPNKLIGIGLNYRDHAEEVKASLPKEPLLFAIYSNAVIGPDEPIIIPAMSQQVDYEAELAVVIGARARHVSAADALQYVAGYTIVNDVSARDLQYSDKQWLRAKSFDTFAPMGPYLVTRADLHDADGLAIKLRLNGQTMQDSTTSNLIFKVPALVSHISKVMTLEAGDVISTGTPSGVGHVRKPPVYLKAGDIVEVEIAGIGVLRNPVADFD